MGLQFSSAFFANLRCNNGLDLTHRRFFQRFVTFILLLSLFVIYCINIAEARPAYAQKEGRACQYCHTSSSPGLRDPTTGMRETTACNQRGLFYGAHNHSFEGYVEPKRTNAQTVHSTLFRFVWKEMIPDTARRVAVGDVRGDGVARLITLNAKPGETNASVLTVKKWNGSAFLTEFRGDAQSAPDKLQVGRFAGLDRPAVIVTGDALWYWDGKTYARKPAARPLFLFGTSRLKDGTERLLIASGPETVKAYHVNVQASGADWLTDETEAPPARQVQWADMHATSEFFDKMGLPAALAQGGVIGVWTLNATGKTYLYHAAREQEFDIKKDGGGTNTSSIVVKGTRCFVSFQDAIAPSLANTWNTPSQPGDCLDVFPGNPKGERGSGLLVLSSGADDNGRTLTFYALP